MQIGPLVERALAGLAEVAEHVRGLLAVAVERRCCTSTSNSGYSSAAASKRATWASVRFSASTTGMKAGVAGGGVEHAREILLRALERARARKREARLCQARAAAAVEQQVVAGDVLDQQPSVAVEDQAARRLDLELAQPVVLGQLAVVVAADDLDEPEADQNRR